MYDVHTLGQKVKTHATIAAATGLSLMAQFMPTVSAASGFESSVKNSGNQIYGLIVIVGLVVGSISLVIGFLMYNSGSAEGMQAGKKRIMNACLGIGGILLVVSLIGWIYGMAMQSGGSTTLKMPW